MQIRRFFVLGAVVLAMLIATPALTQETPETPETPEIAPVPEPADTPEPTAEPESAPAAAAAPSLAFETTVDFEFVKKTLLEGKAGEVEIRGVEFTSGSKKGGLFGSSDADLKASVTARLDCSTTAATKWKVDFTIQFLDGEGNLIDRVTGNASLKSESKIIEINHVTLKYVVPQIKKVKITAVSKGK